MYTTFGKKVKLLRIDNGIRLKDLASALSVSSSFLSAVETGRKNIPEGLVQKVCDHFNLVGEQCREIEEAAVFSKKEIRMNLEDATQGTKELAVIFARTFSKLDNAKREKLIEILKEVRE